MSSNGESSGTSEAGCGLYVHIPFCETKCGYCDFYSVALKGRDVTPLVDRVVRELEHRLGGLDEPIRTVFVGGGTPTVLSADRLATVVNAIGRLVPPDGLVDFTVEANPATVDDEKARILVGAGVGRVSMGAQSFFPQELEALERIHCPDDIAPSVETLRRNGIRQINLDLIFGIPGQTVETWSESLRRTLELAPDHIACYGLTYEPGTRLTAMRDHDRLRPCDEDLEASLYVRAMETLESAGYAQYEISNFARPGCESRHNLMYWRNQPYIGVGPSATGCVNGQRYKNVPDAVAYVRLMDERGNAEIDRETIDTEKLMIEMLMMQLRLVEGLCVREFRRRTGVDPLDMLRPELDRLCELGLVQVTDRAVALTRQGRLVGDAVIGELVCACGAPEAAQEGLARS